MYDLNLYIYIISIAILIVDLKIIRNIFFPFTLPPLLPPSSLEHSTILYEDSNNTPLLRVAWNKQDRNYLSVRVNRFYLFEVIRTI